MKRGKNGRFLPGQTGNRNGRPRKPREPESVFQVIIEQQFSVMQNGVERRMTAEEVLQWKTYNSAMAGSLPDSKVILKMIAIREEWFAEHRDADRKEPKVFLKYERDPIHAHKALTLLGIARQRESRPPSITSFEAPENSIDVLELEPWVSEFKRPRPGPKAS